MKAVKLQSLLAPCRRFSRLALLFPPQLEKSSGKIHAGILAVFPGLM